MGAEVQAVWAFVSRCMGAEREGCASLAQWGLVLSCRLLWQGQGLPFRFSELRSSTSHGGTAALLFARSTSVKLLLCSSK